MSKRKTAGKAAVISIAAIISATSLTGCFKTGSTESNRKKGESVSSTTINRKNIYAMDHSFREYKKVIQNPEKYLSDELYELNFDKKDYKFAYSLVQMQNTEYPQLLVAAVQDSMEYIQVFNYDEKNNKLIAPKNILQTGAASAGGLRAFLCATKNHNGLIYYYYMSGTGKGEILRVKFEGDKLVEKKEYDFNFDEKNDQLKNEEAEIKWHDMKDYSPFLEYVLNKFTEQK